MTGKIPELWHPDTGRWETVALYTVKDGLTTIPIQFDPVGSVFVIFRTPSSLAPHPVSVAVTEVAKKSDPSSGNPEILSAPFLQTDAQKQTVLSASQNGNYSITWSDGSTKSISVRDVPAPLTLEGAWNLEFPPFTEGKGTAVKTTFERLISWSDSSNEAIKYFSGTAIYTKIFTLPKGYVSRKRQLALDLGTVKNIAEVTLNGKSLGILWKEPFQADVTGAVKEGENTLRIKVTNLWPNRLIGDQKLEEKDRVTWTSVSLYKVTDPLLPSGLIGPVTLRSKAVVALAGKE